MRLLNRLISNHIPSSGIVHAGHIHVDGIHPSKTWTSGLCGPCDGMHEYRDWASVYSLIPHPKEVGITIPFVTGSMAFEKTLISSDPVSSGQNVYASQNGYNRDWNEENLNNF